MAWTLPRLSVGPCFVSGQAWQGAGVRGRTWWLMDFLRRLLKRERKPQASQSLPRAPEPLASLAPFPATALGPTAPACLKHPPALVGYHTSAAGLEKLRASGLAFQEIHSDPDASVHPRNRPGLQEIIGPACGGRWEFLVVPELGELAVGADQMGLEMEFLRDDLEVFSLAEPERVLGEDYRLMRTTLDHLLQCTRWRYADDVAAPAPSGMEEFGAYRIGVPFGFIRWLPSEDLLYLVRKGAQHDVVTVRVTSHGMEPGNDGLFSEYLAGVASEVNQNELLEGARCLEFMGANETWFYERWFSHAFAQAGVSGLGGPTERGKRLGRLAVDSFEQLGQPG